MPFSFVLPTTCPFSFIPFFSSDSHPSLPLAASTYRGVLRDTLKEHKLLSATEQVAHLSSVHSSLINYIPYLLAIDRGLSNQISSSQSVDIVLKSTPTLKWRPTLSDSLAPGREITKIKIDSLEYEIYFTLSTLAYTYTLLSRASLYQLYSLTTALPSMEQRTVIVTTATKNLLTAGSIHEYLSTRCEQLSVPSPCIDISQYTFKALASLALAEATLLAVFKDDPYPAIVAQDRNKCDKEWMIKPPEIPKVRANLFARLCLAAAEHATNGLSLLSNESSKDRGKINPYLLRYMEEFKKTSRGKACRFFGISAEHDGQIGTAIAWLKAAMYQLGMGSEDTTKMILKRFKKGWEEKREDRRINKISRWGTDAGKLEEVRILDLLEYKWTKMNNTISTQTIPPIGPLIATMPSGRDIHSLKPYVTPSIGVSTLEGLRAANINDDSSVEDSLDQEIVTAHTEVFNGIQTDYPSRGGYY